MTDIDLFLKTFPNGLINLPRFTSGTQDLYTVCAVVNTLNLGKKLCLDFVSRVILTAEMVDFIKMDNRWLTFSC